VTAKGYKARRLEGGMPEWRLAGLPVALEIEWIRHGEPGSSRLIEEILVA
jgi:hypothetical protein